MLKWLILFGGGYLAYRWVKGVLSSLFVVHKDEPEVKGGGKREHSFDDDDVVDVKYREVQKDDPGEKNGDEDRER